MAGLATFRVIAVSIVAGLAAYGIAYSIFYLPVQAAHGETTTIVQTQNFLANIQANVALAWGAGGAGVAYGVGMHRKLLRERKQKDARITELEKAIDPQRTSSGLTPAGGESGGPQQ